MPTGVTSNKNASGAEPPVGEAVMKLMPFDDLWGHIDSRSGELSFQKPELGVRATLVERKRVIHAKLTTIESHVRSSVRTDDARLMRVKNAFAPVKTYFA